MEQQYSTYEQQPQLPMKWHKFLIYFSLWASAAVVVFNGITLLTGMHYGGGNQTELVYRMYEGMKPVDLLFGLVMIAFAIAYIITRFQLAGMKRQGTKLVVWLPLAVAAFDLLYPLAVSFVTDLPLGELMDSASVGGMIGGVVLAMCNRQYYGKRDFMFSD